MIVDNQKKVTSNEEWLKYQFNFANVDSPHQSKLYEGSKSTQQRAKYNIRLYYDRKVLDRINEFKT